MLRNAELRWPHGAVPHRATRRCRATAACPRSIGGAQGARRRPRGRRDHHRARRRRPAEPAGLQRRAARCAPWPRHPPPSSARSATRTTIRCSTRSPTCAPRRRPTRRSGSCPTSRSSARSSPSCARASTIAAHAARHPRHRAARAAALPPGAAGTREIVDRARRSELHLLVARGPSSYRARASSRRRGAPPSSARRCGRSRPPRRSPADTRSRISPTA